METQVNFDGLLTPSCIRHLVSIFIKHILYQRGQIPLQFEALEGLLKNKETSSNAQDPKTDVRVALPDNTASSSHTSSLPAEVGSFAYLNGCGSPDIREYLNSPAFSPVTRLVADLGLQSPALRTSVRGSNLESLEQETNRRELSETEEPMDVHGSVLSHFTDATTQDIKNYKKSLRAALKVERTTRRRQRNEEKLRRKVGKFLASFDEHSKHLSSALSTASLRGGVQVALLLGATPVSPREVYVLQFPPTEAGFEQHPDRLLHRRGVVQLFRSLVTSSRLLELTANLLSPTNLHVLVSSSDSASPHPELVPRPGLALRRGKLIQIRLRHPPPPPAPPVGAPGTPELGGRPAAALVLTPCCGRPPRRLDPCCARYAKEMGLSLLNMSSGSALDASGARGDSESDVAGEVSAGEDGEEGDEVSACRWYQVPVTLRGFRSPLVKRCSSGSGEGLIQAAD